MEQKKIGNTTEIRLYTGNGFEDFTVGEKVLGNHIFSDTTNKLLARDLKERFIKQRTPTNIEVWTDCVIVDFDTGETFEYVGLKYRHGGIFNMENV